jgi:hypothetical protein
MTSCFSGLGAGLVADFAALAATREEVAWGADFKGVMRSCYTMDRLRA